MKTVILFLLTGYKIILSPLLHQLVGQKSLCRYELSCSEYAKSVITKYGIRRGSKMAFLRLVSCQSFIKTYATV